ncbi:NEAT domain-containing protein [Lysinibacillus sp. NPDC093712]|uniref:NEAT domain-containing protein n=1 Tax=Lysinibacillus sp. NPDC093712 TaxID=3390579 RepID=UPI003CFD09A4
MKKFLQYVAMVVLMLGAILPGFGMEVKAEANTVPSCAVNYSANIKILNEQQTADSMMNSYVQKEATVKQKDGQYTVEITVPQAYTKWYQDFTVESGGELKAAIGKTTDTNGNDIYTFVVDQYQQTIKAWVKVDIPELSYKHDYIVYLDISNVSETNRVCEEAPEQPGQPGDNTEEVITKNVPFTFLTNNKSYDTYFKSYINYADLATAGLEKYAYIKLTGHTYAFTTLKVGSENGEDVQIVSSEGEGNSLVRVIKVKLDANLKATVVMSGDKYTATPFTFDFAPAKEKVVYLPEHFNSNNQVIEFGLTPVSTGAPAHTIIASLLEQAYATKTADNKIAVTMNLVVNDTTKGFSVKQGNNTVAEWTAGSTKSVIKFTVASLENLTFTLTTERNGTASAMSTTVEKVLLTGEIAKQEDNNSEGNTNGSESGSGENNNNSNTGGNNNSNTENNEQSTNGLYTVNFTFLNESGSGSSIMNTYVDNQAYVVKNGSSYQVQLTLKNSSWITGFTVNGATPSTISDSNDVRVVQFTVSSLTAIQNAWVKVDIADLNYHHDYNVLLKFDEGSLSKINNGTTFPSTGGSTNSGSSNGNSTNGSTTNNGTNTNTGTTGNFSQEGIVKFEFANNAKEIAVFLQNAKTVFENNKYKVTLSINIENNLQNFIVKQNGKEIAKWSNKVASLVPVAIAKTTTLSFEADTLDNLVFEAVTTVKTISSNVTATTTNTIEKNTRQSITYKMEADPNGNMADFITNYLAPYFTKAELVTIDGKRYIEMTLIGKAYGFETLAYIDGNGKQQNIEVISSTGEKMDQVRVVRLPLVQDSNGVTKIFIDSGSLGYGAYTLFFTFNVPALEEETNNSNIPDKPTTAIKNPFTDIDNVFSKDEILALYASGITTGTTATTFSPNKNITRAQFAVMIARALNIQSAKATAFKDVKGQWYENEVQALAEVGIVTGVNATTFNPNANITRQQAAAMILRMVEYKGYKVTVNENALSYKDADKVFDYAKQAVSELQALDIMTGSNGYLNPQSNLTRAQMAKILKRSLELVHLID